MYPIVSQPRNGALYEMVMPTSYTQYSTARGLTVSGGCKI